MGLVMRVISRHPFISPPPFSTPLPHPHLPVHVYVHVYYICYRIYLFIHQGTYLSPPLRSRRFYPIFFLPTGRLLCGVCAGLARQAGAPSFAPFHYLGVPFVGVGVPIGSCGFDLSHTTFCHFGVSCFKKIRVNYSANWGK